MKKLNRKGFTLVELLAVIIILAVVVGFTIPAVLTTTQKAKERAFQNAADSAADWFDRQYQVATTGLDVTGMAKLDKNFKTGCYDGTTFKCGTGSTPFTKSDNSEDTANLLIQAAGLKLANVASMKVEIDITTGRTCVTLTADTKGDYAGAGKEESDVITSSSCK